MIRDELKPIAGTLRRLERIIDGNGTGLRTEVATQEVRLDALERTGRRWRDTVPQLVVGAIVAVIAVTLTVMWT